MSINKPLRCLICKSHSLEPHSFYPSLCSECGSFNYSKRQQTANLTDLTALITGARVRIGYGVALKLLRDGAQVIATSRFPHDAAQRYAQEADFSQWKHRLQIYGLDLRHLESVQHFVKHILSVYPRLDIIINNAAQTIRRPPIYYRHLLPLELVSPEALPAEVQPLLEKYYTSLANNTHVLYKSLFDPDETNNSALAISEKTFYIGNSAQLSQLALLPEDEEDNFALFPPHHYTQAGEQLDLRPHNSWLMKDDEVSIWELLEVHVINAIAPFVINSRLKPLLKKNTQSSKYIVNVSSQEGRFNGVDKPWRHPHTNMAKAAFNQMTRTCAKEYAKHRIFMNSVDPGWISWQQPYFQQQQMQERGIKPPFDVIDAAARICDPIYVGLNEECNNFGKLFKNYLESDW